MGKSNTSKAYLKSEEEAEAKAQIKRDERIIKRWTRLVHGLRVRKRLKEQYAGDPQEERVWLDTQQAAEERHEEVRYPRTVYRGNTDFIIQITAAGGFMTAADDVVEPYHLPKYQHVVASYSTDAPSASRVHMEGDAPRSDSPVTNAVVSAPPTSVDDYDDVMEDVIPSSDVDSRALNGGVPLTMAELAKVANHKTTKPKSVQSKPKPVPTTASKRPVREVTTSSSSRRTLPKRRATTRKRVRDESSGSESEMSDIRPSPSKRVVSSSTAPTNGRVLRKRATKSAAVLREERETEKAYRRAIAE